MEANDNSEHKKEIQYSTESTTLRSGQSSSSTDLQDKPHDSKHKKRFPENDSNTSDRLKKQKNDKMEEMNGNQSYDVSGPSRHMAAALQQRMVIRISPNQPVMHQPPIHTNFYPPPHFGFAPGDSYVDASAGNYGMIPPYNMGSMMPMPAQWPVNNGLAIAASSVDISSNACATPVSNGLEMLASTSSAAVPFPYMSMASENYYGMVQPSADLSSTPVLPHSITPNFNPNGPIYLSNALLTPPLPGENITRRPKPDGCRTVYVGCLPEKITQDIIQEAFERCGKILTIRMSEKHFCHIRFVEMESVEQALLLSGYRIKIKNKDDPAYTAKLHVDYAIARDDQHDFECRKRQKEREERHRVREGRPPSPPPIPHFSKLEAISVNEKLRNAEMFKEGARILITWLDRGECCKKNCETFYSMLQSSNSHAERLTHEKSRCEEEVKKAKENLDIITRNIQFELSEIEKVFAAAVVQKNFDHFTKNDGRRIENWKKEITNFSAALITSRFEEDMDENVEECSTEVQTENDELYQLREINDTLKQQLTSTQEELNDCKQTCNEYYEEIIKLKSVSVESQKVGSLEIPVENGYYSDNTVKDVSIANSSMHCVPDKVDVTENEICLITLMSVFLHFHPFGASIDYICSYLLKTQPAITARDVESLLRKFPNIFEEVSSGIGATLEKKWKYVAFDSSASPNGH